MKRLLLLVFVMMVSIVSPTLAIGDVAFRESECPFRVYEPEQEGESLICGYLRVPESRSGLSDVFIELAVVILKSKSDNPTVPTVYFEGGPGGAAIPSLDYWAESAARDVGDVVLFDQRGTGYSTPSLNCIEYDDFSALPRGKNIDEVCHDRLVEEGITLGAYTTAESSTDFADLISALGYEQVNIYGISYGSRFALGVMRDYPKRIRSAVLEGVYPPQVRRYEELATNGIRAFNLLFDDCEDSRRCNEAYPELRRTFFNMIRDLNRDPMIAEFDGEEFPIFGSSVVDRIFDLLYITERIPYIPAIIAAAAERDFETFADLALLNGGFGGDDDVDDFSEGLYTSIECYDEVPFNSLKQAEDSVALINTAFAEVFLNSVVDMFDTCAIWDIDTAKSLENEPVESAIPTLILNGQYDPITPPAWGKATAEYLPNSYVYTFPGMGHGVVDLDPCPTEIFVAFLQNPTEEPDASCLDDMNAPVFYIKR